MSMRTILSAAIILLLATGCNKPKCWVCTKDAKSYTNGPDYHAEIEYCDKTRKEIRAIEDQGTLDNGLEIVTTICKAK